MPLFSAAFMEEVSRAPGGRLWPPWHFGGHWVTHITESTKHWAMHATVHSLAHQEEHHTLFLLTVSSKCVIYLYNLQLNVEHGWEAELGQAFFPSLRGRWGLGRIDASYSLPEEL